MEFVLIAKDYYLRPVVLVGFPLSYLLVHHSICCHMVMPAIFRKLNDIAHGFVKMGWRETNVIGVGAMPAF